MNVFQQAWIYITKEKKKNIILFFIMLFLCNIIAISILIWNANNQIIERIQNTLNTQVTVQTSPKLMEERKIDSGKVSHLTTDILEKIGTHKMVREFDYNQYTTINPGTATLVYRYGENEGDGTIQDDSKSIFNVKGVYNNNVLDMTTKVINLVEGRVFTADEIRSSQDVVLISKEVASLNNLIVGDNLEVENTIYDFTAQKDENDRKVDVLPTFVSKKSLDLKIIGIYELNKVIAETVESEETKKNEDLWIAKEQEYYLNQIYVPNGVASDILEFKAENQDADLEYTTRYDNVYYLSNTDDLKTFKEDISAYIPEYYDVYTAADMYGDISASISSTKSLSKTILVTSILFSIIILIFVCGYFIRNRSNEMAIYLSLGMKRMKVVGRVMLEMFFLAIITLFFTLITSYFVADGVSNLFIVNQLDQEIEMNSSEISGVFTKSFEAGQGNLNSENSYIAEVDILFVVILAGAYLLVVFIGTALASYQLLRLNPKDIFLE